MNTAHTPGKWNIIADVYPPTLQGFLIEQDGAPIAHVPLASTIEGRDKANAELIASAPTLLAQRNALLEALKLVVKWYDDDNDSHIQLKRAIDHARHALNQCKE